MSRIWNILYNAQYVSLECTFDSFTGEFTKGKFILIDISSFS